MEMYQALIYCNLIYQAKIAALLITEPLFSTD